MNSTDLSLVRKTEFNTHHSIVCNYINFQIFLCLQVCLHFWAIAGFEDAIDGAACIHFPAAIDYSTGFDGIIFHKLIHCMFVSVRRSQGFNQVLLPTGLKIPTVNIFFRLDLRIHGTETATFSLIGHVGTVAHANAII